MLSCLRRGSLYTNEPRGASLEYVEHVRPGPVRIVITTDTGTATTRGLHLSREAMTCFEPVAFTLPAADVHERSARLDVLETSAVH